MEPDKIFFFIFGVLAIVVVLFLPLFYRFLYVVFVSKPPLDPVCVFVGKFYWFCVKARKVWCFYDFFLDWFLLGVVLRGTGCLIFFFWGRVFLWCFLGNWLLKILELSFY